MVVLEVRGILLARDNLEGVDILVRDSLEAGTLVVEHRDILEAGTQDKLVGEVVAGQQVV